MPPTPSPETPTMLHTLSLAAPAALIPRLTIPPALAGKPPVWLSGGRADYKWRGTLAAQLEPCSMAAHIDLCGRWVDEYEPLTTYAGPVVIDHELYSFRSSLDAEQAYWVASATGRQPYHRAVEALWRPTMLRLRTLRPFATWGFYCEPAWPAGAWDVASAAGIAAECGWMRDVFDFMCPELLPNPGEADCTERMRCQFRAAHAAAPELACDASLQAQYNFGNDLNSPKEYLTMDHVAQVLTACNEEAASDPRAKGTWWLAFNDEAELERAQAWVLGLAAQVAIATVAREVTA